MVGTSLGSICIDAVISDQEGVEHVFNPKLKWCFVEPDVAD